MPVLPLNATVLSLVASMRPPENGLRLEYRVRVQTFSVAPRAQRIPLSTISVM